MAAGGRSSWPVNPPLPTRDAGTAAGVVVCRLNPRTGMRGREKGGSGSRVVGTGVDKIGMTRGVHSDVRFNLKSLVDHCIRL
jgi:hypothetical protein